MNMFDLFAKIHILANCSFVNKLQKHIFKAL